MLSLQTLFSSIYAIVISYSTDEGLTWKTYEFTNTSIHVYGVLTEPGEKTTIFTIFGSYEHYHSWLVVQVDTKNILGKLLNTFIRSNKVATSKMNRFIRR